MTEDQDLTAEGLKAEVLNQWAAGFLGYNEEAILDGYTHRIYNTKGCAHHEGKWIFVSEWNPCQDRNQAQLVVDKINDCNYDVKANFVEALLPYDSESIPPFIDIMNALTVTPKQIIEAAHKAVTS